MKWLAHGVLGVALLSCHVAAAQIVGRSVRIVMSDSLTVSVSIGADASIIAYTSQGGFRLHADSATLANWAKATAMLPPPKAGNGGEAGDHSVLPGTILRATDGSGNAMRILRLTADSIPAYQLAGTNGAWEFRERISPANGVLLLDALMGASRTGVVWRPVRIARENHPIDYHHAEFLPDSPHPKYPAKAELARVSGEVVATFAIGIDGRARLESLMITRSTHPLFALAVREALPRLRFVPATLGGNPVEETVLQTFQFKAP